VQHSRGLPPNRSQPQPHGGSLRAKGPATVHQRPRQRAHLWCETQPGASAQPLATSAAWRQPAGKEPCHRPTNAFASVRTFGAKHSRGLPPNRSQPQPHGGSLRAKDSCQRHDNAFASARTFGAKHSRGLPPNRSQPQPHGGSLRAKSPCQRPNNALTSARTFGAKHSRGLPPDR